jgi:hypothetical protein
MLPPSRAAEPLDDRDHVGNGSWIVLYHNDCLLPEPASCRLIDNRRSNIDRDLLVHDPFARAAKLEPELRLIFFCGNRCQILGLFGRSAWMSTVCAEPFPLPTAPGRYADQHRFDPNTAFHDGFSLPSVSLAKGGGAIRGMGERFAANPVTGTASMTVYTGENGDAALD